MYRGRINWCLLSSCYVFLSIHYCHSLPQLKPFLCSSLLLSIHHAASSLSFFLMTGFYFNFGLLYCGNIICEYVEISRAMLPHSRSSRMTGRYGRLTNILYSSKTARKGRRAPTDCCEFQRTICISIIQ